MGQACHTPQGIAHHRWRLRDHGYSGMNNGTKVHELKALSELKAAVNVALAQPEKYGKDFDVTVSYLGQMVTKKNYTM